MGVGWLWGALWRSRGPRESLDDGLGDALRRVGSTGGVEEPQTLACLLEFADLAPVRRVLERHPVPFAEAAAHLLPSDGAVQGAGGEAAPRVPRRGGAAQFRADHLDHAPAAVEAARSLWQVLVLARPDLVAELSLHARLAAGALRRQLGVDLPATDWRPPPDAPAPRRGLAPWASPAFLPRPILLDGSASLQGERLGGLVRALAGGGLEGGPAVAAARATFRTSSLEALAAALFQAWRGQGCPATDRWALQALAHFPSPGAVAALVIDTSGSGKLETSTLPAEVLAAMGTREALVGLCRLGRGAAMPARRSQARRLLRAAALEQGLDEVALAERLIPEVPLLAGGTLPGTPGWRCAFTPLGNLQVLDSEGLAVAGLGLTHEGLLAPGRWRLETAKAAGGLARLLAHAREALEEGAHQLRTRLDDRVELDPGHFAEVYLMHPLLRGLAGGVVWGTLRDGALSSIFTVGAQGPEDLAGQPAPPPVDPVVVVPREHFSGALRAAWRQRLAWQPIPQLAPPPRRLSRLL